MPEWSITPVGYSDDIPALLPELCAATDYAWLDGAAAANVWPAGSVPLGRWSLVARAAALILEQPAHGEATLRAGPHVLDRDESAWKLWRRTAERLPRWPTCAFDLCPGWVGFVGFELARQLERLHARIAADLHQPRIRMALYDAAIVLDHTQRAAFAIAAAQPGADLPFSPTSAEELAQRWEHARSAAVRSALPVGGSAANADAGGAVASLDAASGATQLRIETSRAQYHERIARAREYIAAGDIYQVNLAHRLELSGLPPIIELYARLRDRNPAPYSALLAWDDHAIASASPELFLHLRDGRVTTRPIKGTRPRGVDAEHDARLREELLACGKDAAELAMIVDLHRNDLGRVCEPGSVCVTEPRRLETHPRVLHTVATLQAQLRQERSALDLLEACFPAGSISGVPKIRALQIIDELETAPRGAYTGAIGLLGLDGQLAFNVAIRTLQIRGSRGTLHVGGGVVAESDADSEYDETLAKARGVLEALGVTPPRLEPARA